MFCSNEEYQPSTPKLCSFLWQAKQRINLYQKKQRINSQIQNVIWIGEYFQKIMNWITFEFFYQTKKIETFEFFYQVYTTNKPTSNLIQNKLSKHNDQPTLKIKHV